jgi:hypothetical protein
LHELPGAQGAVSGDAVDRRDNGRVGQIEFGLALQRGGARGGGGGLRDLGLE